MSYICARSHCSLADTSALVRAVNERRGTSGDGISSLNQTSFDCEAGDGRQTGAAVDALLADRRPGDTVFDAGDWAAVGAAADALLADSSVASASSGRSSTM